MYLADQPDADLQFSFAGVAGSMEMAVPAEADLGMMLELGSTTSASMLAVPGFVNCLHHLVAEKMLVAPYQVNPLMAPSVKPFAVELAARKAGTVADFEAAYSELAAID